jgi:hypothetical protein
MNNAYSLSSDISKCVKFYVILLEIYFTDEAIHELARN